MFENVNLSNVAKDGRTYKLFDDGFIISNKGITYFEGTAIDYILAEKSIKCIANKKIENKSDHLLCIANFEV